MMFNLQKTIVGSFIYYSMNLNFRKLLGKLNNVANFKTTSETTLKVKEEIDDSNMVKIFL